MRFLLPLLLLVVLLPGCPSGPPPEKVAEVNEVVLAKEGIKALKVGDKAPAFSAATATGEHVVVPHPLTYEELLAWQKKAQEGDPEAVQEKGSTEPGLSPSQDVDKTYTVLYFYPADFTPNSSKHLLDLSKGLDQLAAAGVKVYGVTTGTADTHRVYMEKQGISVPLLVDTGTIATDYGVLLAGGKFPQRTLVGIKPDGTIGFYKRGFGHLKLVDLILKETGKTAPVEAAATK
jgi:peroxiredoxin